MTEDSMRETLAQASGRYSDEEWAALVDSGDPLDQCTVTNARAVVANILEALAHTPTATPSDEGWRPIESAPKDGRRVLLWADAWAGPAAGIWANCWTVGYDLPPFLAEPTHWMPLPEPPSAIEGEKK